MILDGKETAKQIRLEIAQKLAHLERKPGLAFLLIGEHAPSLAYVRAKKKACAEVGITSVLKTFPASISQKELLLEIAHLNQDPLIDGLLVQLPLPTSISDRAVAEAISPHKDVDGFHPMNAGKLLLGDPTGFVPCTPLGVHALLKHYKIPIEGRHVVIVGRSNLVGKPLAALLVQKKEHCNATVTIAHSQSQNLSAITKQADILVAAVGSPHLIQAGMVEPGTVVIDVGINRLPSGQIVGDVDFHAISQVASHITPVPGGIGPMTIAMLLQNTLFSRMQKPC